MAPVALDSPPAEARPDAGDAGPRRPTARLLALVVLAVLSAQFAALSLHQARNDSLTLDESIYLTSGLATLYERELRINVEAPFLPKVLHALPLRIAGVEVPLDGAWSRADTIDEASYPAFGVMSGEFALMHAASGDLHHIAFLGRLVPILEGLAIGWVLYALGARLFSRSAGLLAAGAWLTTPLAVGFAHVNGLDLPFTLAVVTAALALDRHLRDPSWRTLAVLALAAGALQLVRHTGVLYVAAICLALLVLRWRDGRRAAARDVAVVAGATWALVWVAIFVVAPVRTPVDHEAMDRFLDPYRAEQQGPLADAAAFALDYVPWPAEYEVGFDIQLAVSSGESPGYILGDAWEGARPVFWPLSLLVKLPTPVVAMVLLAPLGWRLVARADRRRAVLVAVVPMLVAFAFALQHTRPLGLRYVLPGVALALVVASPVALALVRRRAGQVALGAAVLAQLVFLWSSVPHSLAWTAPPFRPGYRVVSESNLDWGQDGGRLASWMHGRTAYISYFGFHGTVDGLPGYRPLGLVPPEQITGWVAVSATNLTTYARDDLAWLRGYCNVGTIGGTILLYHFEEPPTAEPGPTAPAGRCDGPTSERV